MQCDNFSIFFARLCVSKLEIRDFATQLAVLSLVTIQDLKTFLYKIKNRKSIIYLWYTPGNEMKKVNN